MIVIPNHPRTMKFNTPFFSEFHCKLLVLLKTSLSISSILFTLIQDPLLSAEDVERLRIGGSNRKPLSILKKVRTR